MVLLQVSEDGLVAVDARERSSARFVGIDIRDLGMMLRGVAIRGSLGTLALE